MRFHTVARPLTFLACAALASCGPANHPAPPAPPPVAATAPAPPKPATPPRLAHMICRNSQDGRKVECGTPNAVMVGMTYD